MNPAPPVTRYRTLAGKARTGPPGSVYFLLGAKHTRGVPTPALSRWNHRCVETVLPLSFPREL